MEEQILSNAADAAPLKVNGIVISAEAIQAETQWHADQAEPDHAARQALVVRELLTQQARSKGLLGLDGELDDETIDELLALECPTPVPSTDECLRYYTANAAKFRSADMVFARHILFALVQGAPMVQIREYAEELHRELGSHPDRFDALAKRLSNCPSGQVGGNLGQLTRGESVPEFETALFEGTHVGLLPGLVKTRYGFHIVVVERRIPGIALPFAEVSASFERYLCEHVRHKSIQQYVTVLLSAADLQGITLDVKPGLLLQ